jgi:hypothetical protein
VIRWDMFLKGCSPIYWKKTHATHGTRMDRQSIKIWEVQFTFLVVLSYKSIWYNRNSHLYGKTWQESKVLLWERVHDQVRHIYRCPPRLARCYKKIHSLSFVDRQKRSTTYLQRRLSRLGHQIAVSKYLHRNSFDGQQNIKQAFQHAHMIQDAKKYRP